MWLSDYILRKLSLRVVTRLGNPQSQGYLTVNMRVAVAVQGPADAVGCVHASDGATCQPDALDAD